MRTASLSRKSFIFISIWPISSFVAPVEVSGGLERVMHPDCSCYTAVISEKLSFSSTRDFTGVMNGSELQLTLSMVVAAIFGLFF